jgi:hypothetical protein
MKQKYLVIYTDFLDRGRTHYLYLNTKNLKKSMRNHSLLTESDSVSLVFDSNGNEVNWERS